MTEFNTQQRSAVEYPPEPLLILAGAGTGKTTTIVGRMAYLIQERKVDPDSILALTFTNDAANHLKEKLVEEIGKLGEEIQACTFHSFAQEQTNAYFLELGYSELPKIMNKANDVMTLIAEGKFNPNTLAYNSLREEELKLELIRNKILGGVLVLVIFVLLVFK